MGSLLALAWFNRILNVPLLLLLGFAVGFVMFAGVGLLWQNEPEPDESEDEDETPMWQRQIE